MIRPYLSDMITYHKTRREWKIQLTMSINFISFKDSDEIRTLRAKSNNIKIVMGNKTDEIIDNFLSLFYKIIKNIQVNQ